MVEEAAAAGRTIVCCNWPPLDGNVTGWVLVIGWAHSPSGIHEVEISVDGVRQAAKLHLMARPDVKFDHGIDSAQGFIARLDADAWGDGEHAIAVSALAGNGDVARASGVVTVSPHGPYRAWLEGREAGRTPRLRRAVEPSIVDGRDLSGKLRDLAARDRGYLLLVEPDGELARGAAALIGAAHRGGADLVYADEDAVVGDGGRGAEFLKPGWSPELLLSADYIGPLLGVGPRAAQAALEAGEGPIGGIYELCLRLVDAKLRVERVPEVLFTSRRPRERIDYAAAQPAIEALGERRGLRPRIEDAGLPGARHVRWEIRGEPKVSLIIPTAAAHDLVGRCLASIAERSSWRKMEVVLVDSSDGALAPHLGHLGTIEHSVVPYEGSFNFSAICNLGAARASGDYLVLLNDDTEVRSPDWIERMLEQAQLDGVGVVGAKLLFGDGDVQHGGVSINRGARGAAHMFAHLPGSDPGYNGLLRMTRNVSAVTAACMMVPARFFDSLGGFDEEMAVDLGDTDFCLRAVAAGERVVLAPRAELLHHQQSSRPVSGDPGDLDRFVARWQGPYSEGDPLYHPAFADFPSYDFLTPLPESNIASSEPSGDPQASDGQNYAEERFTPDGAGRGRLIEAEHQARYRWAAQVASGRELLDAGCGAGYGTAILARAGARRAVGVDASEETVTEAAKRFGEAEFVVGDLQQLPFEDRSFDLVACFEAIEHLADYGRALDELRRVTRDDGLLLVSSPNRRVFPPGNHWHVHEFFPEELEEALLQRFANVRLYRQQANLASSISPDEEYTTDDPEVELGAAPRRVAAGTPGSELYTVAAASDAPLPEMSAALVMTDSFDIGGVLAHALAMDRHARDLEQQRDAILASPSWRVTAPLRALKRLVGRGGPE